MRLPQPLLVAPFFAATDADEVLTALGIFAASGEGEELRRLHNLGLPPVTSVNALSVMFGLNSGLIWSFINRPRRHYRQFSLAKGKGTRIIAAPRVGLKIIQSWLAYHLTRSLKFPYHVFGFVPGRSHIDAAFEHRGAQWAYSVDIEDFFGSTPQWIVAEGLIRFGYSASSAQIIAALSSLNGRLTQGSPASPALSNVAFLRIDKELDIIATNFKARMTRYADDIVFSGNGQLPEGLINAVQSLFASSPWSLSHHKTRIEPLKGRIKVHGLIVNGVRVRLTKGYRNKIRAYRHVLRCNADPENARRLVGHITYADHVSNRLSWLEQHPPIKAEYDYPDTRLEASSFKVEESGKREGILGLLQRIGLSLPFR